MTGRVISITNTRGESKSCHPLSTGVKGARVAPGSGLCQAAPPPLSLYPRPSVCPSGHTALPPRFAFLLKWPRAVTLCVMITIENPIDLSSLFVSGARRVSHGCWSGLDPPHAARPPPDPCGHVLSGPGIVAKGSRSRAKSQEACRLASSRDRRLLYLPRHKSDSFGHFFASFAFQVKLPGSQAQLRPQQQPWGLWPGSAVWGTVKRMTVS